MADVIMAYNNLFLRNNIVKLYFDLQAWNAHNYRCGYQTTWQNRTIAVQKLATLK